MSTHRLSEVSFTVKNNAFRTGNNSLFPRIYGFHDRNFNVSLGISNVLISDDLIHHIGYIDSLSTLTTNTRKNDVAYICT